MVDCACSEFLRCKCSVDASVLLMTCVSGEPSCEEKCVGKATHLFGFETPVVSDYMFPDWALAATSG